MATNVADLLARLSIDISSFKQGLDEASRLARGAGGTIYDAAGKPLAQVGEVAKDAGKKLLETGTQARGLTDVFRGLGQQGASLFGNLSPLVLGLGGVGTGLGLAALAARSAITEFTGFTTRVRDLSFLSGGSARDVSILVAGLDDLGVESDTVQIAMARMSRAISDGDPVLVRLGIRTRDVTGVQKNGLQLFYEMIEALRGVSNENERNAMTTEIFGRSWVQMIEAIRRGSGEIQRLGQESGKIITPDDIQAVQDYNLAWRDLLNVWERVKIGVGRPIVEALLGRYSQFSGNPELGGLMAPGPISDIRETVAGPGGMWPKVDTTLADLQRRLVAAQTVQYSAAVARVQAGAMPQGLQRLEAELRAAEQLSRASRDRELTELEIALKKGEKTEEEAAQQRQLIRAKSGAEIAKLEQANADQVKAIRDAEIARNIRGLVAAADEQIALDEKLANEEAQTLEERWKNIQTAQDNEIAGWVSVTEGEIAASESAAQAELQHQESIQRLREQTFEGQLNLLEEEKRAITNALTAEELRYEQAAELIQKIEDRKTELILGNYDRELSAALNAKIKESGIWQDFNRKNQDETAAWYQWLDQRRQKDFDNAVTILRYQAREQGSVWFALQAGAVETYGQLDNFWDNLSRGFTETFHNIQRGLSDTFFDVLTGNFKDLEDVVASFGKAMLRTFTDIMAAEVTKSFLNLFMPGSLPGLAAGGTGPATAAIQAAYGGATSPDWGGGVTGGGGGGGGGILSPVINLLSGLQKVYGLVTGTAQGGIMGGIDQMIGVTKLVNTLTGSNYAVGSFGGMLGGQGAGWGSSTGIASGFGAGEEAAAGATAATIGPTLGAELGTVMPSALSTGAAAGGAAATTEAAGMSAASVLGPVGLFAGAALMVAMDQIMGVQTENAMRAASGGIETELMQDPAGTQALLNLMLTDPAAYWQTQFARDLAQVGLDPWAEMGADVNRYMAGAQAAGIDPYQAAAQGLIEGGVGPQIMQFANVNAAVASVTDFWNRMYPTGYDPFTGTTAAPTFNYWEFGNRQGGGPVSAWQPYWIGEKGPELFVPGAGGYVLSHEDSMRGGAGFSVNGPLVHIDNLAVREEADLNRIREQLGWDIERAVGRALAVTG